MRKAKILAILLLNLQLFNTSNANAQSNEPVSDFYEYANKEWIKKTKLPENYVVINQAGILWEEIEKKSLEILSGTLTYELDEEYSFALHQLRNFYKSTSDSIENPQKRVEEVQKNFPMIFGIVFSKITISKQKEEMINEIIRYLTLAYRYKIENTSIIGSKCKEHLLKKLDILKIEIGAPSLSKFPKIPNLSDKSFVENLKIAKTYRVETVKIPTDWRTPYETDCFYYAGSNKINVYAGSLLDFKCDDDIAFLFATLGRTIAHEMTHAFDMVGEKFDMTGRKVTWMKRLFSGLLFCNDGRDAVYQSLIDQYNKYSYSDSLFVDGSKTIQENFADFGGVEVSILALKMYLKGSNSNISGKEMNEWLRKYFIFYAQFWKEKATPEYEIMTFKRIHTPQKFRAIGPIYNQYEFYEIFEINKDSKLYILENKRISVW